MLFSCRTTSARRARSKAGQLWCADNGPTQQTDREDKFIQNFHRKPFTSHQQPFYNKSNFVVLIRYVSNKKLLAPSCLPWCVRNRTRFGFVKAGHSVRAGWEFFFSCLSCIIDRLTWLQLGPVLCSCFHLALLKPFALISFSI